MKQRWISKLLLAGFVCCVSVRYAAAQTADGTSGINQANTLIRGYFEAGTNLMYGVCAILALIGAVRVYNL